MSLPESAIRTMMHERLDQLRPAVEEAQRLEEALEAISDEALETSSTRATTVAVSPKSQQPPKTGLTSARMDEEIIQTITSLGPLKSSEIAAKISRPSSSVSRTLTRMAKRGKVQKSSVTQKWEIK